MFVCSLVTVYVDWYGDAMEFGHGGLALCGRAASSERRSRLVGGVGHGSYCVAISFGHTVVCGYAVTQCDVVSESG